MSTCVWDGRKNNFDAIRLALAILVIYSHSYPLGSGSEMAEPMVRLSHGQMTLGGVAVDLFFVMSGFLIAGSAERSRSLLDFLRKRVARIYPAFIVAVSLTMLLVVPLASVQLAEPTAGGMAWNFVQKTLRLREFSYNSAFSSNPYPNAINGSLWSVFYEFWCYIGVALLVLLGWLRRPLVLIAIFAASWAISILSLLRHWNFGGKLLGVVFGSPQLWARLLPLYLAGVLFYVLRRRIPLRPWMAIASAVLLGGSCLVPVAGWAAMFPLAGTYLVFALAFSPVLRLQSFGRFGDFSYGTYLYAFPIQQMIMRWTGHAVAPLRLFLCAAPVTLLAAVCSWYCVERRFLRPKRLKQAMLHAAESVA